MPNENNNVSISIPLDTVRTLILTEMQELYDAANMAIRDRIMSDLPREFLNAGYQTARTQVLSAKNTDELSAVCGTWYGMDLAEWLRSYYAFHAERNKYK